MPVTRENKKNLHVVDEFVQEQGWEIVYAA
jgi:hypothetical protein